VKVWQKGTIKLNFGFRTDGEANFAHLEEPGWINVLLPEIISFATVCLQLLFSYNKSIQLGAFHIVLKVIM